MSFPLSDLINCRCDYILIFFRSETVPVQHVSASKAFTKSTICKSRGVGVPQFHCLILGFCSVTSKHHDGSGESTGSLILACSRERKTGPEVSEFCPLGSVLLVHPVFVCTASLRHCWQPWFLIHRQVQVWVLSPVESEVMVPSAATLVYMPPKSGLT